MNEIEGGGAEVGGVHATKDEAVSVGRARAIQDEPSM